MFYCYNLSMFNSHFFGKQIISSILETNTTKRKVYTRYLYYINYKKLTNRFHVAVRLFTNRSERTSKCGKNKKVAHKGIAECVNNVLTTF